MLQQTKNVPISDKTLSVIRNFFNHHIKFESVKLLYIEDHIDIFEDVAEHFDGNPVEDQIIELLDDNNFAVTSKEMKFLWRSLRLDKSFDPKKSTWKDVSSQLRARINQIKTNQ